MVGYDDDYDDDGDDDDCDRAAAPNIAATDRHRASPYNHAASRVGVVPSRRRGHTEVEGVTSVNDREEWRVRRCDGRDGRRWLEGLRSKRDV